MTIYRKELEDAQLWARRLTMDRFQTGGDHLDLKPGQVAANIQKLIADHKAKQQQGA